jgi:hypothetical protein
MPIAFRLISMEETYRREKDEADRLLRKQKLEYESKIEELQKQVMETSMYRSQMLPEDSAESDQNRSSHSSHRLEPCCRLFVVRVAISISVLGVEEMALPSNDQSSSECLIKFNASK